MFNEVYGAYYDMMRRILERASCAPVSARDVAEIVAARGFAESALYFTPDALSHDGTGYNLLRAAQGGYASCLKHPPAPPQTANQRRFLRAMLDDPRIALFLDDKELGALRAALEDVPPLFRPEDILLTDTAADGDEFADAGYRARFAALLGALRDGRTVRVVFNSSRGYRRTLLVAPWRLEYDVQGGKFRLCGVSLHQGSPLRYVKINAARMSQVNAEGAAPDIDVEAFVARKMPGEPIVAEISDFRNGFERIFIGLSNYRRVTAFDEETGKCTMQIFCMDDDVQELLIVLLSYGPAVRVLGPPDFREKFVARVRGQLELMRSGE